MRSAGPLAVDRPILGIVLQRSCSGLALVGALALGISLLPARTITVDDDGPANFRVIQQAIAAAVAADVVSVAPGLYRENLVLKDGITVLGAGSGLTTVDGGGVAPAARLSQCGATTRLQGFTLTGGLAAEGGGVLVEGGAPVITLNTISGNRAIVPGGVLYGYGGGLALMNSAAVVTDNILSGNEADFGGGIHVEGGSARIARNQITGNTAGAGGGIDSYAYYATGAIITANTITANTAIFGGGLDLAGTGAPIVSNNLILGNTAAGTGSGSAYGGGADLYYSQARLLNNTVGDNVARHGGGVSVLSDGTPAIVNNIFLGNQASSTGGAAEIESPLAVVTNNIFHLNARGTCDGPSAFLCLEPTNLEADPGLVDAAAGDFRLRADSPAVDSGTDAGAPAEDIRGERRPIDGNGDGSPAVDRGVHEYDRNAVTGLVLTTGAIVGWKPVAGAGSYHVYSGSISTWARGVPDLCRDADDPVHADLTFSDGLEPPAGEGIAYLVTAVIAGVEQSPGFDDRGIERVLPAPCP